MALSRWARRLHLPLEGRLATYVLLVVSTVIVGTQALLAYVAH